MELLGVEGGSVAEAYCEMEAGGGDGCRGSNDIGCARFSCML